MIQRFFVALRLRFGLRATTCARKRRSPFGRRAPFKVVQRDGLPMIEPR